MIFGFFAAIIYGLNPINQLTTQQADANSKTCR